MAHAVKDQAPVGHWPGWLFGAEKLYHKYISGWIATFLWWLGFLLALFLFLNAALYISQSYVTLPLTKVAGLSVGGQSRASAALMLENELARRTITIHSGQQSYNFTYEELGISIDSSATFDEMQQVDGFLSLPLPKLLSSPILDAVPTYQLDHAKLLGVMSRLIQPIEEPSKSAAIIVPSSFKKKVKIKDHVVGQQLNGAIAAEQVVLQLTRNGYLPEVVLIKPEQVFPATLSFDLESKLSLAEKLRQSSITVKDAQGNKKTTVPSYVINQMLESKGSEIVLNARLLKQYLRDELSAYFYVAAKARRETSQGEKITVDDKGKSGLKLDEKAASKVFSEAVLAGSTQVVLPTKPIKAPLVRNGHYPRTDAGLATLLSDFDKEKRASYRLIVHEMKDGGLHATHNALLDSIPASTYKAFLGYVVMKHIDEEKLSLDTQTREGTVAECMYEMIHVSTDHCAYSIQDHIGWDTVDMYLRQAGIFDTKIDNKGLIDDKSTTAMDEFKLMRGLADGSLLSQKSTDYLLTLFKEQMWRSGIPGGSSPSVVADKVGFFAGWINDVGIVYAPSGKYLVIALSDGGSFWEINDLSRRVYNFLGN